MISRGINLGALNARQGGKQNATRVHDRGSVRTLMFWFMCVCVAAPPRLSSHPISPSRFKTHTSGVQAQVREKLHPGKDLTMMHDRYHTRSYDVMTYKDGMKISVCKTTMLLNGTLVYEIASSRQQKNVLLPHKKKKERRRRRNKIFPTPHGGWPNPKKEQFVTISILTQRDNAILFETSICIRGPM